MEGAAAVAVFARSEQNDGLRYTWYYGDGDSSSFQQVENIYDETKVVKYECIGHYQKRVGNTLRKLRKQVKGLGGASKAKEILLSTADGKVTKEIQKAKGKLTDAAIFFLFYFFFFSFFFSLCIFSQVPNIPERIILISTTGLR